MPSPRTFVIQNKRELTRARRDDFVIQKLLLQLRLQRGDGLAVAVQQVERRRAQRILNREWSRIDHPCVRGAAASPAAGNTDWSSVMGKIVAN